MHFLAQEVFWEILRGFFYITTSGASRTELLFYDKSKVSAAVTCFFDQMVAKKQLKVLKKALVHKIIKDIPEAPKLARVYLRPKTNLSSMRMITRKEKDGGNDRLEATRYLLDEISRRLFHCTVIDVKGNMYIHSLHKFKAGVFAKLLYLITETTLWCLINVQSLINVHVGQSCKINKRA